MGRSDRTDFVEDVLRAGESEFGTESRCDLRGQHPVGTGRSRRCDPLGHGVHAALDVRRGSGLFGETGGGENDVGPTARRIEDRVDRDHGAGAGEGTGGKVLIGKIAQGVGAEEDEHVDPTVGGGPQDSLGVEASGRGHLCPAGFVPIAPIVESDAAGKDSRSHTHVERAPDVRTAKNRKETGVGSGFDHRSSGVDDSVGGFGHRRATENDLQRTVGGRKQGTDRVDLVDGDAGDVAVCVRPGNKCPDEFADLTRSGLDRGLGQGRDSRRPRGDLDQGDPIVDRSVPETQEQNRKFFLDVGGEQQNGSARGADVVDRRCRKSEHNLGGKTVTELRIDVVGSEDALGEFRPGVVVLVGETCSTDDSDRLRRGGLGERIRSAAKGIGPAGRNERVAFAEKRLGESTVGVDGFARETTFVAQPAPVDRVDVDSGETLDFIARRVDRDPAADRAHLAGRLGGVEIPRAGLEAIAGGGERADRADLDGVAAEVRRERFVRERVDLGVVAAVDEVDQRIAGDFLGKTGAAVTQDATLAVEQHEIADRDRLLLVTLLLDETALAGAEGHRLVLERTFATLVAYGAIEGMVHEQELEDTVLRLLRDLRFGVDLHSGRAFDHAARLKCRAATRVDFDKAHAAHADRLHPLVIAEPGYVGSGAFGRVDEQFALSGNDLVAVDLDGNAVDRGSLGFRHGMRPSGSRREPTNGFARRTLYALRIRDGNASLPTRSARPPMGRAGRSSSASEAR